MEKDMTEETKKPKMVNTATRIAVSYGGFGCAKWRVLYQAPDGTPCIRMRGRSGRMEYRKVHQHSGKNSHPNTWGRWRVSQGKPYLIPSTHDADTALIEKTVKVLKWHGDLSLQDIKRAMRLLRALTEKESRAVYKKV